MLRIGQRVQISKTAKTYTDGVGVSAKDAGGITTVVDYAGKHMDINGVEVECYYVDSDPHVPTARNCLYPIDDEPCEEGFLEEFKNIVKEKVT